MDNVENPKRKRNSENIVGNIWLNWNDILQYNNLGHESIRDSYSCDAMTRNDSSGHQELR